MHAQNPNRRQRRMWLPLLVVIGAALLVVMVFAMQGGSNGSDSSLDQMVDTGSSASGDPSAAAPDLTAHERRDKADLLAAGPVDAPVGMVVFSDYQCGFCARWNNDTLPTMMALADAGELRIEWRDLNVFGETSERASRASVAAAKQGKFWEYHNALFPNGEKLSEQGLSEQGLTELAASFGLDTDQFAIDMNSVATANEVVANAQLGLDLGAASTPVFLLGGQPISGAQPTEVFVQAFETARAAAAEKQAG